MITRANGRRTSLNRIQQEERSMATHGLVYDPTIRDALKRKETTLDELKTLRAEAIDLVRRQGNLALALIELDEEIKRREG
jgi:hypothetical protein